VFDTLDDRERYLKAGTNKTASLQIWNFNRRVTLCRRVDRLRISRAIGYVAWSKDVNGSDGMQTASNTGSLGLRLRGY